ncbi:MAG: hypothetical protein FJ303_00485 [Planctomycetes bacterium]|nr:hypothetical protein [Planctomycetota bacterium]
MATRNVQQLSRELGDEVLEDAKQNPSACPGKYVGIANGKVVVCTDDLSEPPAGWSRWNLTRRVPIA